MVTDPTSAEERSQIAAICSLILSIRIPVLLDALNEPVAWAYGAWPDRPYLVSRDGRIIWQGAPGPAGFKLDELESAIRTVLGGA